MSYNKILTVFTCQNNNCCLLFLNMSIYNHRNSFFQILLLILYNSQFVVIFLSVRYQIIEFYNNTDRSFSWRFFWERWSACDITVATMLFIYKTSCNFIGFLTQKKCLFLVLNWLFLWQGKGHSLVLIPVDI
jgi:hypothetical protein